MDLEYALQYRTLYNQHWWWRAREHYILNLLRHLPLPQPASILDIGCGDGLFFDALENFGTPYGIEPDQNLLSDDSKWRPHIWSIPFDRKFDTDQRFNLILMLDVLEHIDDDVDALQRAVRFLKPGGIVLLTVPALGSLWTDHDVPPGQ